MTSRIPLWILGPALGPFLGYWFGWGLLDHFEAPLVNGTFRFPLAVFTLGGAIFTTFLLRFVDRNTLTWKAKLLGSFAVVVPALIPVLLGAGDRALRRSLDQAIEKDDASAIGLYSKIGIDPRGASRLAGALKRAVKLEKPLAARALVVAGANPNRTVPGSDAHSVLYLALRSGRTDFELTDALLTAGAKLTPEEVPRAFTTDPFAPVIAERFIVWSIQKYWRGEPRRALYDAVRARDVTAAEAAVKAGAKPDEVGPHGITLLQVLAEDDATSPLMGWLMGKGAKPEVPSDFGYSAIRWGVVRDDVTLLDKLVRIPQDVKFEELLVALRFDRPAALAFLVEKAKEETRRDWLDQSRLSQRKRPDKTVLNESEFDQGKGKRMSRLRE